MLRECRRFVFALAIVGSTWADQSARGVPSDAEEPKNIVFVAGRPSHGYGAHEHNAGCRLLAAHLKEGMPKWNVQVMQEGESDDATVFDGIDCLVVYSDGGTGHPAIPYLPLLDQFVDEGVGVVCIHYAVEVPKGDAGRSFLNAIGGYFETDWSVNPHWKGHFQDLPKHPITRGVEPFAILDEWYYHMRFRDEMKGITPILTALPPAETLRRPDGPHSGNAYVREAVLQRKEPQHVAWASELEGQRGFGFTGGHFHWNWGDRNFRKLVLNAIAWCAHAEVPAQGLGDGPVTIDDLTANQDEAKPNDFDLEAIARQLNLGKHE